MTFLKKVHFIVVYLGQRTVHTDSAYLPPALILRKKKNSLQEGYEPRSLKYFAISKQPRTKSLIGQKKIHLLSERLTWFYAGLIDGPVGIFPTSYVVTGNRTHDISVEPHQGALIKDTDRAKILQKHFNSSVATLEGENNRFSLFLSFLIAFSCIMWQV